MSAEPSGAALQPCGVRFRGVRGSAPVSGREYRRFGGATLCLDVAGPAGRLIVDAGTGLGSFGQTIDASDPAPIEILLTHYHIDHVMGLLNFPPLFRRGARVVIHAPILAERAPESVLPKLFDEPFFPVRLADAGADVDIRSFRVGERFSAGGFELSTILLSHPGGACGYRLEEGSRSIAVILDHEHGGPQPEPDLAAFCRGVDLLLYDAAWDEGSDYEAHRGWGHSTWQAGLRLMEAAGAKRLGCLHHAPEATDMALLARERRLQRRHAASFFAREGSVA